MDLRNSCERRYRPIVEAAWRQLVDLEIPQMVAAPGGWGDDFRAVLTEVADLLGDRPPQLIVITGGGARMAFTSQLCDEIFPSSAVEQDKEPAFTVARGLVSNGQHQANVRRFRRDISDLINARTTTKKVRAEAVAALEDMKEKVAIQVQESRASAAEMGKHIAFGVFETRQALEVSLRHYMSTQIEIVCRRYGVPESRVHFELAIEPRVFKEQLKRVLDNANGAEKLAEHAMPVAFADLVRLALNRFGGKLTPAVVSAIGAVTSSSGLAAERAARHWIQQKLRVGEYSRKELDKIVAEVMDAIANHADDLAVELES